MSKTCVACGMPMNKPEEFAMGDTSRDCCVYCARPDGSMKSYDETLAGMTQFMVASQGIDEAAAREVVRKLMDNLPAWRGQGGGK